MRGTGREGRRWGMERDRPSSLAVGGKVNRKRGGEEANK